MPDQLKDNAGYKQLFAHLAAGKRRRGGAQKPRAKKRPSKLVGSGRLVGLPGNMHLQPVCEAELETANRILARWLHEHPEVTRLVFHRQDERQPNDADQPRPANGES